MASQKRKRTKRKEGRQYIRDYKAKSVCCRCGFSHPAALQFHHTRDKKFAISDAPSLEKSIEQIKEELLKCEVVCANCHLIHHYDSREEEDAFRDEMDAEYQELMEEEQEILGDLFE